ncbi:MAG: ATP-grasp domain-containing protein [Xanthomonadaceae bacterium]|nr:ATP-grasp domain-containing protein [Xanthomonadaceae bacterium]
MSETKTALILGNGQLAQILRNAGKKIEVVCEMLAPDQINAQYLKERYDSVDAILFESEFTSPALFTGFKDTKKIFPSPAVMKKIQNKLTQKEIVASLGIPQPTFSSYVAQRYTSVDAWVNHSAKGTALGTVFKWAMHGYDGKGVFINLAKDVTSELFDFCREAVKKNVDLYCEQYIPFKREFAIVSTRSQTGQILHYPLVETVQKKGVCFSVEGPSSQLGVPPHLKNDAEQIAKTIGESQDIVGTYAIELFEGEDSKLYINEIAPRVHNSGHYSIEASAASQFENHLRACLGMELIAPKTPKYFFMLNLLGPEGMQGTIPAEVHFKLPKINGVTLHWYNKLDVRPYRKLGHLTYVCASRNELRDAKTTLTDWVGHEYSQQLKEVIKK